MVCHCHLAVDRKLSPMAIAGVGGRAACSFMYAMSCQVMACHCHLAVDRKPSPMAIAAVGGREACSFMYAMSCQVMACHCNLAVDRKPSPMAIAGVGGREACSFVYAMSCHVMLCHVPLRAVNHEAFPYGDCRGWWIVKLHLLFKLLVWRRRQLTVQIRNTEGNLADMRNREDTHMITNQQILSCAR